MAVAEATVIRAARPGDAPGIAAIYAPVVADTVISFEEVPPEAEEMARRMLLAPRLPWLVAETPEGLAGYAYASRHHERAAYRWSAACSIFLAPGQRGRGLGRRLYERLIREVRALGYVTLYAGITLPNPASVGLHEALGFTPVGVYANAGHKLGSWYDVGWWQLPLREPPGAPAEPRAWRAEDAPDVPEGATDEGPAP